MKNQIIKYCALVLLSAGAMSCEKDYGVNLGPVEDSVADIPVTVTNATFFERYPVITTSIAAGGTFTINMEIPADKGKIREITKVATGPAVVANFSNLNNTAVGTALNTSGAGTTSSPFVLTPLPGNGTNQISYTSKLTDYLAYRIRNGAAFGPIGGTATAPTIPVPSTTAVPTDIQYYFRLTLEDGRTIVPMPVRIRVIP